jgi:AraC family transcriptional regulator, dual regulator of chb operon
LSYIDEYLWYIDIMKIEHLKSEVTIDPLSGINFSRLSAFLASTRMHDHDFAELFIINRGGIIHKVNGRSEFLKEGQIVFIRPEDVHCFGNAGTECELYNLAFNITLIEKCAEFAENGLDLSEYFSKAYPPTMEFPREEKERIVCEMEIAVEELIADPKRAKMQFSILVLKLFSLCFSGKRDMAFASQIPGWLEQVCEKMKSRGNYIKGLVRMQELAYCSPEHLCRSCKAYLGKSPTEFINELRINFAASKLIHSDEKIFSIAIDSGFSNLSHFYHQFKKHNGLSPAIYRKKQQQNVVPK